MRPTSLLGCLVLTLALVASTPARADFHFMKVVEVFAGAPAAPNAKYVVIQMYAPNQGNLPGHEITVYGPTGTLVGTFNFPGNINPKPNQTKILIATPEAKVFFNNTVVDLTMDASLLAAGGKVCFDAQPTDCVAWGNWSGSSAGVGPAFNAPDGIPPARAARRRVNLSGGSTTLEAGDDTDNSASDFFVASPTPQGSDGISGVAPFATCGNSVIEGLEQCDDGNTTNGDSCSSVCETTTPTTSLSVADASVAEGNAGTRLLTFTVSLSQAAGGPVTYTIATADGTATAGSDYVARTLVGETIPAGMTSKTFSVTLNGDTTPELGETLSVNVSSVSGALLGDGQAVGTITNDDGVVLSIGDAAISEGNSGTTQLVFTLVLDKPSPTTVTYNLATSDGTATGSSGDYFPLGQGGETFPPNTTSKTVAIPINGDTTVEANETFNVTLSAVTGATVGDGSALGFITNDDGPTLSIADVAVAETQSGTRLASFVVRLSQPVGVAVGFNIATTNAGAIAPTDFVARSLAGQAIPPGETTYVFSVTINGDSTAEQNENFLVKLSGVTGPVTVADGTALGTILNDDGPTLSINDVTLVEGNAGTYSMNFNVTLSTLVFAPVTYTLTTASGSATAGSDFVFKSIVDTMPAGTTNKVFSVITNGDTSVEPTETFFVNITNPSGATAFDGQGQGGLVNDDGPLLSVNDVTLIEGNAGTRSYTFVVKLSQAAQGPVTYAINTADGTATVANADYVARSLSGETIPAGGLSRAFVVTSNGDAVAEANENFQVKLTAATGASILDSLGIGTLTNDDGPTLIVDDVVVTEGNTGTTTATFTLSLTQAAAVPVTYNIATANGNAVAGSDYVARGLVGESIAAGMLSKTFAVTVNGDTAFEPGETFTANLAQASGATIRDAQGIATITNDDSAPAEPAFVAYGIGAVQGRGARSPLDGARVQVQGIVTAVVDDGFYLQGADADADHDAATAEGVFVAGTAPAVGAHVRVRGDVREVRLDGAPEAVTQTRLLAHDIAVLAAAVPLPRAVVLAPGQWHARIASDALERFEGMRVALPEARVVGPTDRDGRSVVVAAGVARPFREPGLAAFARRPVGRDVPVADANPERLRIDATAQRGAAALVVDAGTRVRGLVGVLDAGATTYRLLPDPNARLAIGAAPATAALPRLAPQETALATLDLGDRLADGGTPATLARAAHVVCAGLQAPGAVALSGDLPTMALTRLAAAVNTRCGGAYRAQALPGGGALLLDANRAALAMAPRVLDGPDFVHRDGSRAPLFAAVPVQVDLRLRSEAGDAVEFTLLLARISPLAGALDAPGPHGWATLGDAVHARRQAQALALAHAVQRAQVARPLRPLAVVGGFEAPAFATGVDHLLGVIGGRPARAADVLHVIASPVRPALTILGGHGPATQYYTAVVDGNALADDHVLGNAALLALGARAEIAHLHADLATAGGNDESSPSRDPLRLVLSMPAR